MNNLLTYIEFRGDLNFDEYSFNDIDALIFSILSYVKWEEIMSDNQRVNLLEKCCEFIKKHTNKELTQDYLFSPKIPKLVEKIEKAKRYRNVYISHAIGCNDDVNYMQFGAITFEFNQNIFIGFRGTDNTILGWKENLTMTYLDTLPAYHKAMEYTLTVYKDCIQKSGLSIFNKKKVYLGGHSKGANIAVYVGMKCDLLTNKIINIYDFDGPGFNDEFYNQMEEDKQSKIKKILPKDSIVGRLLNQPVSFQIIDASLSGLAQHDAFTWKVSNHSFIPCSKFSEESNQTNQYINEMLFSKSIEDKKAICELLFKVFDNLDIYKISDLSEINIRKGISGIKELSVMSNDERKFFIEILKFVFTQTKSILFTKR